MQQNQLSPVQTKLFKSNESLSLLQLFNWPSTLSGVLILAPQSQESKTVSKTASGIMALDLEMRAFSASLNASPPTGFPVFGSFGHPRNFAFRIFCLKVARGNHRMGLMAYSNLADGKFFQLATEWTSSVNRPMIAMTSVSKTSSLCNRRKENGKEGPVASDLDT